MAEVASWLPKWKIKADHWFSTQISLVSRSKMSQKSMKINEKSWGVGAGPGDGEWGLGIHRAASRADVLSLLLAPRMSPDRAEPLREPASTTSAPCRHATFKSIDFLWIPLISFEFHWFWPNFSKNWNIFWIFCGQKYLIISQSGSGFGLLS